MTTKRVRWMTLLALSLALLLAACGGDDGETGVGQPAGTTPTMAGHAGHSMASPEKGVDPDLHFIDAMIVHHASAVAMAKAVENSAAHPEIRALAAEIVTAQEAEIEQMRSWRDSWFPGAPESDLSAMAGMAGMAMSDDDLKMLEDAKSPDQMFIEMMIPHHESAIEMATQTAQTTQRPELKQLSDEIVAAQRAEIDQMKQWQSAWFGD